MLVHNPKELAFYLKDTRKSQKLSQEELGRKVGLLQRTISSFENKPEGTKLDTLFRILSAANLQIHIVEKGGELNKDELSGWEEQW